jgi:hypothetical protein
MDTHFSAHLEWTFTGLRLLAFRQLLLGPNEDNKGDYFGEKEGVFNSTHILMKRWAAFERDRRWKNGIRSRDSTAFDRK